jgi:hypothetical protein
MLESKIESHLKDTLEAEGFLVLKLNIPAYKGVPDRMILWPVYAPAPPTFVELKAPLKDLRPLQAAVGDNWTRRGADVHPFINSMEKCIAFTDKLLAKARMKKELYIMNNGSHNL